MVYISHQPLPCTLYWDCQLSPGTGEIRNLRMFVVYWFYQHVHRVEPSMLGQSYNY
jgi:hypothetical protein